MTVIGELLGVPDLDRERFSHWSKEVLAPTSVTPSTTAHQKLGDYLAELVEAKAEHPGEDLLSALIRTRDEDGDALSPDELIGMAFLLLIAGHETTVNLISNGTRALLAHPDQLAALRADYDGLLDGAIEEMLRYDGPVQNTTYRYAREDMELGGAAIPAGATVLVSLAGADRDPGGTRPPTRSTSGAPRRATSPSGTGCTSASAPRSPAWRAASRCAACWSASRTWPRTRPRRPRRTSGAV